MLIADAAALALLGVATNLDNLSLGMAYALRGRRIAWGANLLIAAANASGTAVAMVGGAELGRWIPGASGDVVTAGLFAVLGLLSLWEAIRGKPHAMGVPEEARSLHFFSPDPAPDRGCGPRVRWGEAGALAAALTVSNLAAGVGAGLAEFPLVATVSVMAVCSVAGITLGQLAGGRIHTWIPLRLAGIAAAVLLLVLAALKVPAGD